MDFISQYNTYKFQRSSTTFTKPGGTGIVSASGVTQNMGSAFVLLNTRVAGNTPCRLRLYADEPSILLDANRPVGNYNLSASVALLADIVYTDNNLVTFNPPILGNTFSGGNVWYHLSGSSTTLSATVESYQIASSNDSLDGRQSIVISGSSVPTTGYGVSGSITTPKSFLMLSGSATTQSRLRLYSRPITEVPQAEQTRSFDTQSQDGSLLIADLMFDSESFQYPLVPILEAYTWTAGNYSVGGGEVGYILQNRSGGTANITSSLYIYSTEA